MYMYVCIACLCVEYTYAWIWSVLPPLFFQWASWFYNSIEHILENTAPEGSYNFLVTHIFSWKIDLGE